jgi:glycosyltransferase involved in cell wall biosynthesis
VLVVSGIWPPDVGGPASHAPAVAVFLAGRGHHVEVVTTAEQAPASESYPVFFVSRGLPPGLLHLRTADLVRRRARRADVVYTTGMLTRSSTGARAARRPFVVKLTADPAFERARRRGLVQGDVIAFQHGGGGRRADLLRASRERALRAAAYVVCPSEFLLRLVLSWGVPADRAGVLRNPAPALDGLADRETLRDRLGLTGPTLAFAGRLTVQKSLDTALRALREVPEAALVVAGDGPEREPLERLARELGVNERTRFLGPKPRTEVLELFRAADAAVLPSAWENFPHTVVEALAVGTPVVAAAVGGVGEVVEDGSNGLLVAPGDETAFAAAVARIVADPALRARLREAAAPSVAGYAQEEVFGRLEQLLVRAAVR